MINMAIIAVVEINKWNKKTRRGREIALPRLLPAILQYWKALRAEMPSALYDKLSCRGSENPFQLLSYA